jgi:hypothetical protein
MLLQLVRHPVRSAIAIAKDPVEAWSTAIERLIEQWQQRRRTCRYETLPGWDGELHRRLGVARPRALSAEFWAVWRDILTSVSYLGYQVGPESFAAWNDGDAALTRAVWCLVRHLRPLRVVETGVARGFTTRVILEALQRNGAGHLWSIDLPPQLQPELHAEIGIAVSDQVRHRWSYIKGSSRRHLPALLEELGEIDLFVHDSLHTDRNVRFEMERAWTHLRPNGALVVDDIDANCAFRSFVRRHDGLEVLLCRAEPVKPDLRRENGAGVFGIIRKPQRR